MSIKRQNVLLVLAGLVSGILISVGQGVFAEHDAESGFAGLPVDDLRTFSDVFGRIKNDYVEEVKDNDLLENAMRGMLAGLDPHSAYLDNEQFKELQVGTTGEFGGLGIEVGMENGFVKVDCADRRHTGAASRRPGGRPDHSSRRYAGEGADTERCRQDHARQTRHRVWN